MDFIVLAQECAPQVAPQTLAALVTVESSHNPYAIGVVGGSLQSQPRNLQDALASAQELLDQGRNFSLGLTQVNRHNLAKHKVTVKDMFDPCTNLRVGAAILENCYIGALKRTPSDQQRALQAAFSCYYSGNYRRGFIPDKPGEPSYVDKVVAAARTDALVRIKVPAVVVTQAQPSAPRLEQASPPIEFPVLLEAATEARPSTSNDTSPRDQEMSHGEAQPASTLIF